MVDGLRPYPEYRSSHLPWAEKIPAHWDVRRNARLFAERNETGFPDLPILEVSIRTGVTVRDLQNGKRKQMMTDRAKYKRAVRGDIAYNMMRMWQGAVGTAPVDGLVSPAYVVARPFAEVDSRYYSYLFRTRAYMNEVNKFSRGIVTDRNRLYWEEFRQMPSIFPPPQEQKTITSFLDSHAALVAKFIRTKRRQIELLSEQRRTVIDSFLTGARLEPVPPKWERLKLKRLVSFNPSKAEAETARTGNVPVVFLPMERVSIDGHIDCSERRPISEVWDGYTYFRRDDVVIANPLCQHD
jgi:type I restriction enzyme S subunit